MLLQVKAEKCGSTMWSEVPELAKLLREGSTRWEDLNLDDVDIRMKFAGLFHRGKRTPQRFMMRLKVGTGACRLHRVAAAVGAQRGAWKCETLSFKSAFVWHSSYDAPGGQA